MYHLRKVTGVERKFLGVCGGISKYINPEMDPALIRVIWIVMSLLDPAFGILLYFILAIALHNEEYKPDLEKYKNCTKTYDEFKEKQTNEK